MSDWSRNDKISAASLFVTIVVAITGWWSCQGINRKDANIVQPAEPRQAARGKTSLTPSGIRARLEALSPYQQKRAKADYVGLEVDWPVKLYSIDEKGLAHFSHDYSSIYCTLDLGEYPEMKVAAKDQRFRIRGRIAKLISLYAFELENAVVSSD
jgi:hypothetical protein